MEYKSRNKNIVEIALTSAIILILMMISTIPMFYFIGIVISPIPVTILYLRNGRKTALASVVVSGILNSLLLNPINSLLSAIMCGIVGVTLGICISKKKKAVSIMVYLTLSNIIVSLIEMVLSFSLFSEVSFKDTIQQMVDMNQEFVKAILDLGINTNGNEQMIQMIKSIDANLLTMILPLAIIILGVILAFFQFSMTTAVLKRLKYNVKSLPLFSTWYLDNKVGAVLIIINCIAVMLKTKHIIYGDVIYYTTYNILIITFIVQGLSVISYFLKNKMKLSKGLIVLLNVMIFTSHLVIFVGLLGVADLLLDIRGIDSNSLGTLIRKRMKS